ncbi:MAG: molybdate ABC transporter substrate-binding protein [Actinobacteria bacterium]|nr:molybdate ABC transporter substrate-binding protein [Actinomycetota bacterium]
MIRVAALAAFAVLAGCGGEEQGDGPVVFAASSLGKVAPAINPDAAVVTGGSNDLAAQIRDGAEADIFLSASAKPLAELRAAGLVEAPVVFASNRLVIIVPAENEARVTHVADLARPGVKLVLGADGVPVGDYARESLDLAGLGAALDNVVSLENDVKGVVGKVALGEADAGIVYATDARTAEDDVRSYGISGHFQPDIRYYAAIVAPASERAREYLDRLTGDEGQAALRGAGFLPVPP